MDTIIPLFWGILKANKHLSVLVLDKVTPLIWTILKAKQRLSVRLKASLPCQIGVMVSVFQCWDQYSKQASKQVLIKLTSALK